MDKQDADLDAPAVASRLIAIIGACNANAQQLSSLQDWVSKIAVASKTK